jgi:hypothetical protein
LSNVNKHVNIYGISEELNLWLNQNLALIWLNMAENLSCTTIIGGSLLYQISANSLKHFIGPFMVLHKLGFIVHKMAEHGV